MALYLKKSDKRFVLGPYIIKAVLTYQYDEPRKLVAYNFPFNEGVFYEDNGEGAVSVVLEGLFCDFININTKAVNDINDFKRFIQQSSDSKFNIFYHPELTPINVKIENWNITQTGAQEGYRFMIKLVKFTPVGDSVRSQLSVEKDFDAGVVDNDEEYTIISGDTLWGIANRKYGDGKLYRKVWNYKDNSTRLRSGDPSLIYPNEKILLPNFLS